MSTSLAMSPAAGGGDNGGGGGAEEKKVVMEEAREELDHTLDLRLCSDVMMAETEEKAERESGSGSKGSDGNGEEKRGFYCKYCNKKFANSQALGGHQNAHKRERGSSKKDKVDEEAFAQIESHLYPYSSIAPYNRLYGSYRKPLGVQSQSMISKPMHSWSRGGLGYGYGGVGGGWPRYSMMNSAQFPIINRARQPSMMNSQYGAAQPPLGTSNYWGGAAGGRCGFQQPPPPAPPHTRHFNNIVGYHHQPPPPPPAQTRGLINLGGIDTTAFRRTFEGISLQIATSKPLDNGIVGCSEYQGGGGVVAENSLRQEVRGGGLLKKEKQEEAKEIDLSLRL